MTVQYWLKENNIFRFFFSAKGDTKSKEFNISETMYSRVLFRKFRQNQGFIPHINYSICFLVPFHSLFSGCPCPTAKLPRVQKSQHFLRLIMEDLCFIMEYTGRFACLGIQFFYTQRWKWEEKCASMHLCACFFCLSDLCFWWQYTSKLRLCSGRASV